MLKDFDCIRLQYGEYGVILETLDAENEVYLVEILEENDISGIPLDMGCPVHISEIKAKIEVINGISTEIPLESFGKSVPLVSYTKVMDITNH